MGMMKYLEDNISIYVGRIADRMQDASYENFLYAAREIYIENNPDSKYNKVFRDENQNGRRGIELVFDVKPDSKMVRKLRLNGWWLSKVNDCWCNYNTKKNLEFAEKNFIPEDYCISLVSER